MLRRSAVLFAVIGCIAALGVAGCGSSSSSSSSSGGTTPPAVSTSTTPTTHFAKTKFVLHFGLAGGAFHRYIYKPFKAGVFGKPLTHKAALVKAALAGLFVVHELKLAATDVKSSKLLSTLFSPLTAAANKASALVAQFRGGKYSAADINSLQASGGMISQAAAAKGSPAADIASAVPGIAGA